MKRSALVCPVASPRRLVAASSRPEPDRLAAVAGDYGAMKYAPVDRNHAGQRHEAGGGVELRAGRRGADRHRQPHVLRRRRNIVALNADAGTEVWKFPLSSGGTGRRGSPRHVVLAGHAPHAPRVLVTIGSGKLVQLDAKTGTLIPERRRHRSRQRDHGPDSRRRVVHDRRARRRLQEPRDLSRAAPASTTAGASPAICVGSICSRASRSGASTPCRIPAIRTSARGA